MIFKKLQRWLKIDDALKRKLIGFLMGESPLLILLGLLMSVAMLIGIFFLGRISVG